MILTKTPFRVSLVGGGTDLAAFYREGYGAVVTTAIDKFIYLAIHRFFEERIVLKYSKTEVVTDAAQVEHPLIRECLGHCGVNEPLELTSFADLPSAGSGLGTSSAFCVGLVKALHAFTGREIAPVECARHACEIEIERLAEPIGKQDQYATAVGGFNHIRFNADESVVVEPIALPRAKREALERRLMLFYTGVTRNARDILGEQRRRTAENRATAESLRAMLSLADALRYELGEGRIEAVGEALHEGWMRKRALSPGITSAELDSVYQRAMGAGATGGKLLGAGGGGFFLFDCPPDRQDGLRQALHPLRHLPFRFEAEGTRVAYYDE
jgi:D-glycero-alpha-D-manno-heptose-7-phosphate kinase